MKVSGTNISMTRGDTESITVHFNNYTLAEGDTIKFTVRETVSDPIILQKTVTDFQDNTNAVIVIDHEDTEGMEFGRYVFDIELTQANGAVITIIKPSAFKLEEEVTYS